MSFQPISFYQTGTFTVGNRLLAPEERSVQASVKRYNSINSGHRACQGCGEALQTAKRVVVLEKSLAVGLGGILSSNVRTALFSLPIDVFAVIAGLGGRAITRKSLHELFRKAERYDMGPVTFLDLDWNMVNKQLEREKARRRSGPVAESLLRDVGVVAARNY